MGVAATGDAGFHLVAVASILSLSARIIHPFLLFYSTLSDKRAKEILAIA
jgi:hypothetical protein